MDSLGGFMMESAKRKMKENKDLLPSSRKAPSESKEPRLSRNVKFEKREFTEEQRIEHEARLKKNKRSDRIRIVLVFAIIAAAIGALALYG